MAETLASDLQRHQSPNEGLAKDLTWLSVIGLGVSSEVGAGVFYLTAQVQGVVPGIGPHVPLVLIVDAILAAVLAVTYWFFLILLRELAVSIFLFRAVWVLKSDL